MWNITQAIGGNNMTDMSGLRRSLQSNWWKRLQQTNKKILLLK